MENKEIKTLKIKREFWELIIKRKKIFEYRKLESGITSGKYLMIDLDTEEILGTLKLDSFWIYPLNLHGDFLHEFAPHDVEFIKNNYLYKHDFVKYIISDWNEAKNGVL